MKIFRGNQWGVSNTGERFWAKVERKTISDCWNWTGPIMPNGYAQFRTRNPRGKQYSHRFAYEFFFGAISKGLTLDHLCRNRRCCNPFHLEPVTIQENLRRGNGAGATNARKTHCNKGHPLSGDNVKIYKS